MTDINLTNTNVRFETKFGEYFYARNLKEMKTITIEYSAKQDTRYNKAFKPNVWVDGKWIYTISRCKKTMRGALNAAKKLAEEHANQYMCNIIIRQKGV